MTDILTEHLVLKPVNKGNISFIQSYFNDPDILKFMRHPVPYPYPPDGAEFFVNNVVIPKVAAGSMFAYIIYQNGEAIGSVGSQLDDEEKQEWHRGFWLAKPYRGQKKKIMEEASGALIAHVFAHTEAAVLVSENAPANGASAKISFNQGFRKDGLVHKNPAYHNGESKSMRWVMSREAFIQKQTAR